MRNFLIVLVISLIIAIGAAVGMLVASVSSLTGDNTEIRQEASAQFFDINGGLIGTSESEQTRIPVSIKKIPPQLEQAFLAAEDIRFYEHSGVDVRGIFRALWANITKKGIAEGGSTITQQLAKNAFLTMDQTIKRKLQEIVIAIKLESKYSKKEIMEMYLNQIYFGRGVYGVEAASLTYFGKSVDKLNLAEASMLAGIPKSPNYYSPMNNLAAAQERQGVVLSQLLKYGFITQEQHDSARGAKLVIKSSSAMSANKTAAYFLDYISQIIVEKYGADALYKGGLQVYTTLDIKQQMAGEEAAKKVPVSFKNDKGVLEPQIALVAVEPGTGYIRAMVGGRGEKDQYNRAVLATRQPGSAMKVFVYLAAVESGMDAATVIEDKPMVFPGGWTPNNYSRTFSGWVSMRTAVARSLNIPAISVAQKVTPEKVIYYARQLGISSLVTSGSTNDVNLAATALGGLTRGVIPVEMAGAMATLANNGVYNAPVAILKIVDRDGKVLFAHKPAPQTVVPAKSAYVLTDLLQTVVARGTGAGAAIGRPAAGKTGTTDTYRDAWFVGYTPNLAAVVWIGNDEGESLPGNMTGGDLPASLWSEFMRVALADTPVKGFSIPAGVSIPKVPAIPADGGDPNALRIPSPPGVFSPKKPTKTSDKKSPTDDSGKTDKPGTPPKPPTPPVVDDPRKKAA